VTTKSQELQPSPPESRHSQDQHDGISTQALIFADIAEQDRVGDCGLSPVPADSRNVFAPEWLHPNVANWRCRNVSELQVHDRQRGHAVASARLADDDQRAAASTIKPTPSPSAKAPSSVWKAARRSRATSGALIDRFRNAARDGDGASR
jgi:hypothetical protein